MCGHISYKNLRPDQISDILDVSATALELKKTLVPMAFLKKVHGSGSKSSCGGKVPKK